MSHDYHDGPEGAVLYDGCAECDRRAADPVDALLNLDGDSWARLVDRMVAVEFRPPFSGDASYLTANEARLGRQLFYIALLQQRHGTLPIPERRTT